VILAVLVLLLAPILPPAPDGGIEGGAAASAQAVRVNPPAPPPPLVETGLYGLPFAPEGLNDCQEMNFYRVQWGLPAVFDAIGWRESNCRNEDGVHTSCCWGYWQLWIGLQVQDHRMQPRLAWCDVDHYSDVNSDVPIDKQRQACATAQLYAEDGMSPWQ